MPASYPNSVKTYTTKQDDIDYPQAAHINELQDEVTAVERGLLEGLEHDLFPKVTAARDLGTSGRGWRSLFIDLGTVMADRRAITVAGTWNNSSVTFTGIRLDITDTASASGSLLLDLRRSGSSVFRVDKNGGASLGSISASGDISTTANVSANRLISNVATGTSPLSVTSTTLVTNLNADMVDNRHSTQLSTQRRTMVIVAPGSPTTAGMVSARIVAPVQGTITAVRSTCRVAPSSGTYTFDIQRNGSTIYTTSANRPTRTSTDGTGVKTHALPDVRNFNATDVFDVHLVSAGSGIQDTAFFLEFDETGQ